MLATPAFGLSVHDGFIHLHALHTLAAQAVKCSRLDQRFHSALVDLAALQACAEVKDIPEITVIGPLFHNGQGCLFTQALDGIETKAYAPLAMGTVIHDKLDP